MIDKIIILIIIATFFLGKYYYDQWLLDSEIKKERKSMAEYQHIASGDIILVNKKYLDVVMMNERGWKRIG